MAEPLLTNIAIRRQVLIERFKSGKVKDFEPVLRAIDRDIRELLSGDAITDFRRARLTAQLDAVNQVIHGHYSGFIAAVTESLQEFAGDEGEHAVTVLAKVAPGVEMAAPAAAQVWAAVVARPLGVRGASGGPLLEAFLSQWGTADAEAITNAIRQGYFEGETNQQIINRIRGTRALGYKDGLLDVSRRHAEAVVRTAVQHVAQAARQQVWEDNDDIVTGYRWVATLDSRTTQICRSLDGQVFKHNKGPIPPAHVNCRSTTVAELRGELAGLSDGGTRASKDGYVDADMTYYEWLKTQDADFQDVALGPTRGKLFRDGGLSSEEFARLNLSRNFEPLSIEEMRRLDPDAFEEAGL